MPTNEIRTVITADASGAVEGFEKTGEAAEQAEGKVNDLGRSIRGISTVLQGYLVQQVVGALEDATREVERRQVQQAQRRAARQALTAGSPAEEAAAIKAQAQAEALARQPGVNFTSPGSFINDPLGVALTNLSFLGGQVPVIGPALGFFANRARRQRTQAAGDRLTDEELLKLAVRDPDAATRLGASPDIVAAGRRAYNYNNPTNINVYTGVGDPNSVGRQVKAAQDRRDRNNGQYTTTLTRRG